MVRKAIRTVASIVVAALLAGCDNYLSGPDVTTDPNKQQTVRTPDQYFIPIQANMWFLQEGQSARFAAIWHQQMAGVERQFASFDVYNVGEADLEGEWGTVYTGGGLIDVKNLQEAVAAVSDRKYLGIAKIYEAWFIGTAADVWGDVPYSEADSDFVTPVLDKQMDIYAKIEILLTSAIADLASGAGAGPGGSDLVYGGNASKWIDFAHTLKARYFLHQAELIPAAYAQALTEAQLGIKKGNDYVAFHSDQPTESNLWYQFQVVDRTGYMRAGKALVDTLRNRGDPRLAQYFDGPPFVGSAPGQSLASASDLSETRIAADFEQPLVTWRENLLIIAEAAFKTGNTGLALTSVNVVRADVGLPPSSASGQALFTLIMTEKWIEDFQKIETFQDYNRTCSPRLTPAAGTTAIPARFLYPINERNSNPNVPDPSAQPIRNQNDPTPC